MAQGSGSDSQRSFSEIVTEWERNFDSMANRLMGTEGFSRAMNSAQNTQLGLQKVFSEMMARHLENMNMPTRDDVLRIGTAVRDLEARIERVEEMVRATNTVTGETVAEATTNKRPGPRRTKQPPAEYLQQSEDKTS